MAVKNSCLYGAVQRLFLYLKTKFVSSDPRIFYIIHRSIKPDVWDATTYKLKKLSLLGNFVRIWYSF